MRLVENTSSESGAKIEFIDPGHKDRVQADTGRKA